ncbi:serine hydrolase [Vitiosangium sp. GDMCC 1.1324]|uniref:serine hydrolase domain-containing protein n=1 Tax=Vitiosangium sp. (strain GDMCC 1.1324) TaxID=2138576 RepID=UPI000D367466|nr:serine hydrolase domain-containing protein [Vitiosangium sp. GDMCC 1.1324]PTL79476.1 serine hydrolase [Vitiosangium sp. GDMCC 1.1324]
MYSVIAATMVAASLAQAPASPASANVSEERAIAARLDGVIDRAIAEKRIVGTVVVVAKDGKVIYQRAAGLADREAGRPMKENELFRLASMSKPIVSVAALALVDQHKLKLEDPVAKWIPAFKPKLADGSEPVITVRHLLTHTAGLTYGFAESEQGPYHKAGVSDGLDESGITLDENLRRIASVPLSYEPGKRWGYSVATDVLGAVVAKAGGAPLPRVVERLVTGPLGLPDTGFSVKDVKRLATPYSDGKPEPVRMGKEHVAVFNGGGVHFAPGRALNPRAFPSGGAGMVGTAGDYVKFLETLRKGGTPVLTASTVEQLSTAQVGPEAETQGPGWGFGFVGAVLVDPAKAHSPQSAGTYQWGGAYGHNWFVDPTRGLTVVALTNTAFEGMAGAFTISVRDALYGTGN